MAATRSLLAILALALAPACGDDSGTVIIGNDPVADTEAEGTARGTALAGQSFDELVGNDFLAQVGITGTILESLNDGEIREADLAVQIVNDDDVFAFANDMITDHEDANAELDAVLRVYGVGFFPSDTADQLAASANADISELRASADPDFTYTELQVINHASALVLLDQLFQVVGPGAMGDFIQSSRDMVEDHLNNAESILATFY